MRGPVLALPSWKHTEWQLRGEVRWPDFRGYIDDVAGQHEVFPYGTTGRAQCHHRMAGASVGAGSGQATEMLTAGEIARREMEQTPPPRKVMLSGRSPCFSASAAWKEVWPIPTCRMQNALRARGETFQLHL